MRSVLLASILLLPLLAGTASAGPKEELSPREQIAEDAADLRRDLARKHQSLARWCKGKKLRRTAHRHLLLVLHFDPDHRSTRASLGYRRSGEGWELRKPVDVKGLEDRTAPGEKYVERDEKIRRWRVGELLELAEKAEKLGLETEADGFRRRALRLAPEREDVQAALGRHRVGRGWFDDEELASFPESLDVKPTAAVIGGQVGAHVAARQSGRFILEGRGDDGTFEAILGAARRADALCALTIRGKRDVTLPQADRTVALENEDEFVKCLSAMGCPPGEIALARSLGCFEGPINEVLWSELDLRLSDRWAHGIVADWLLVEAGEDTPGWMLSGLSDLVSERVVGTMLTRWCTLDASAGLRLGIEKTSAASWRRGLRNLALTKEDPPVGVIFSSSLTSMTLPEVMKSWSVVTFLLERDPIAFRSLVASLGQVHGGEALKKAYRLTPEELDELWRAFVIEHG
jgi:hypothetical protein